MLVTSIFSFYHNVFQSLLRGRLKSGLCGKELQVAKMMISVFHREENSLGKGENAGY